MFSKKTAKVMAFALSLSCVASAMAPITASAAGSEHGVFQARTKAEKYGDDTYANRFMSLYADVIEDGVENGYLSEQNGKQIPYHCVETLNVEAPDYGHETTSEAMSYLVWIASMRDHIVNQGLTTAENAPTSSSELATAWSNMESMIPTVQTGFWEKASSGSLSAQYCDEYDEPEDCPTAAEAWNTGVNPIQTYFTKAYSSENGLYLMHWLADVNDWYGFGGSTAGEEDGTITFINTFQRGEHESCWETVPFACVEELKYGNSQQGIKGGLFNTDSSTAKQYAYTNAPDAEDRAIQGVHDAIRWGNADSSVVTLAGKMGDELRNNFFDKYYKAISVSTTKNSTTTGYESAHYLRNWYTSWGGALDGSWAWQIGCSHVHEFYQNPLAAYALLADDELNSAMKAQGATQDYTTSLSRQLELYLWLQSADGPIAGGATNSLHGRYEDYSSGYDYTPDRGSSKHITSTFYDMIYLEHPVYEDPGSNHWIGNQVWALQRISELYYEVAQLGDNSGGVTAGGLSVEEACAKIMDRWVEWSIENIKFDDEAIATLEQYNGTAYTGDTTKAWAIPSSLVWDGQPDTWTGDGTHDNTGLTCEIEGYGQEVGSTASWANGLIYYAAAKGVDTNTTKTADELIASSDMGEKALGYAKKMLDYQWATCRDDIGLTQVDTNSNLTRFFEETVYVPSTYHGTMPNGDAIESGATFFSLRTAYENDPDYDRLKEAYDNGDVSSVTWTYHRFWHEGDVLMANGVMASLFPSLTPSTSDDDTTEVEDDIELSVSDVEVEVGESSTVKVTAGTATSWDSADSSIATVDANGKITGVSAGTTTVTVTGSNGSTATVSVTVTEPEVTTTTTKAPTTTTTTTTTSSTDSDRLWGDANVDGNVRVNDIQKIRQYVLHEIDKDTDDYTTEGFLNSDVTHDGYVKVNDIQKIRQYILHIIEYSALEP
jgi:hypothetical protein